MGKSNFVIIAHPRCGAHLLMSLLNSHPEINCEGEVFNKLSSEGCDVHFQKYLELNSANIGINGFKLPYVFRNSERNNIWNQVKNNTQFKIIHLSRSNLLRAYVSHEIAKKTEYWFGNESSKVKTVDKKNTLVPKDCIRWINNTLKSQKKIEYEFRYHQSFTLTYENLLFDENKINEVLDFLGVETNQKVSTQYKKQNKEPLSELISNYQEFKKGILNSTWAVFLDQDQQLEYRQ